MTSLLRQIVASPRARHPEANLDLCYVSTSPTIIATSGPSSTYPQLAYRNPLSALVKFLDTKHGSQWQIWEFRAEGTGYPDSEVYGRVRHYPWPDHHPPPFGLVPNILAGMKNWLRGEGGGEGKEERVVVVHCKAGKGRSGTMACSYLISEEGWRPEDAMARFTERRMRAGFGVGISIPSQRRWIGYVERWARKGGKVYLERPVEVLEVQCWGLRDGVKVCVEGFVEEGKVIKKFHTFSKTERTVVKGEIQKENGFADAAFQMMGKKKTATTDSQTASLASKSTSSTSLDGTSTPTSHSSALPSTADVVFRPSKPILLPTSDINLDIERRNRTSLGGLTMVTSVAHVWFNTFFEGNGPEQGGKPDDSGVFEIDFEAMDGIKGSSRKGTASFDKVAVVWRAADSARKPSVVVHESAQGEPVPEAQPADWRGPDADKADPSSTSHKLGLRKEGGSESEDVSRANSTLERMKGGKDESMESLEAVKTHGPQEGEEGTTPITEVDADQTKTGALTESTVRQWAPQGQGNEAAAGDVDGADELSRKTNRLSTEDRRDKPGEP